MNNITFDEKEHKYWAGSVELISVTTRLKAEGFYKGFEFIKDKEYHLSLGRSIHDTIRLHLINRLNYSTLSPILRPYLDGAIKYLKDVGAEVLDVEQTIGSLALKTAGRPDLRIIARGVHTIPDWKKISWCDAYPLQLAGYKFLYNLEHPENPVEYIEDVFLDGKGGYKFGDRKHYPASLENIFVGMVNLQNHKARLGV